MQYKQPTFNGDYKAALVDLKSRGFSWPHIQNPYYAPIAQAIAAGWAYSHNKPWGKWTGGGC